MIFKRFKFLLAKKDKDSEAIEVKSDAAKLPVNNKIVEFVGVSGIGKSTLYHATIKRLSGQWKFNFFNLKFEESLFDNKISEIHWSLLKDKLSNVDIYSCDHSRKIQLLSYFNKVLLDNLKMINENDQIGFFIEEGVSHNFSEELQKLSDEELKVILKNRFLIYVKTNDPSIVVTQIRKRTNEGGHTVFHHIGLNDEQLSELVVDDMKQLESFFNRIEKIKIPFCSINIEDGLEAGISKIVQFENQILRII
ncbi:hypothetical protein [Flavobacterium sp. 2]|uniref:hypothetical protein n=1 Tax=Flavobacterium sp. 2 TaxID=308053 RepID=UPI003CF62806